MSRWIPPIEGLRPGGLAADDVYKPPPTAAEQDERIRDLHGEARARRGRHEDGAPATAAFDSGGLVFYPRTALAGKLPECTVCGSQFIGPQFLAAHRETAHSADADTDE